MKKIVVKLFVLGVLGTGQTWAIDFGNRFSLGGGYGQAFPNAPGTFQDATDDGRFWTAHVKYGLADSMTLVVSYANLLVPDKTTERETEFQPVIGSLRFHPFHKWILSPYLTAGSGVSINRKEAVGAPSEKWTKFSWQGGAGLEFFLNQGTSLGVEGLYHHFVGQPDESPYRLISVAGLVNIYFGEELRTKKARLEAELAKQDAEKLRAEAQKLLEEAKAAKAEAQVSQTAAAEANEARAEAERKAREQMEATKGAQAELDKIKEMIASKSINPINFAPGSANLLVESYETLNLVAVTVKKYPNLMLRVEGHTDSQGHDAYNMRLSQNRADAVKNYLVQNGGLPGSQIVSVGFGETRPIASNATVQGRGQNRRVEFIFFLK